MRICRGDGTPVEFCDTCAPTEDEARKVYGPGEDLFDGRGNLFEYDCEHPPYDEGVDYHCEKCGKRLVYPPTSGLILAIQGIPDGCAFTTY